MIMSRKKNIQLLYLMERIDSFSSLQTPCFILDQDELNRSIVGFQDALQSFSRKSIVGYSVKTNSLPFCLHFAYRSGAYAEVVSFDEYNIARKCGFEQSRIIYNGPMKSKESFLDAILNGSYVNIETKRELEWLLCLPKDKSYYIGLRLNINISKVSPEDADGDNDNSRFGFSDDTLEFKDAIEYIEKLPNVRLAGLHIHRTAHNRSIHFYENSIQYACDIIHKYGLELEYLDVGGGYFGIFPNKPTYLQYSEAFYRVLKKNSLDHLCIIVEPGNALVASCFSFLSEVIDVKQVEPDLWFITTDGSRNDVDPFFRKTSYLDEEFYFEETEIAKEQIISGCTCLEYDRLFSLIDKPLLSVGDRILYRNVGAYTMCLTPLFIRLFPNIYVKEENDYKLIRERWTVNEYLQKSTY